MVTRTQHRMLFSQSFWFSSTTFFNNLHGQPPDFPIVRSAPAEFAAPIPLNCRAGVASPEVANTGAGIASPIAGSNRAGPEEPVSVKVAVALEIPIDRTGLHTTTNTGAGGTGGTGTGSIGHATAKGSVPNTLQANIDHRFVSVAITSCPASV